MQQVNPASMSLAGALCFVVFGLAMLVLALFIWGTIFKKAGYSFWMSLLMLIPLVNVIWLLVFAFSEWPIHKELAMFRSRYGAATSGFPVMPPTSQPPSQY